MTTTTTASATLRRASAWYKWHPNTHNSTQHTNGSIKSAYSTTLTIRMNGKYDYSTRAYAPQINIIYIYTNAYIFVLYNEHDKTNGTLHNVCVCLCAEFHTRWHISFVAMHNKTHTHAERWSESAADKDSEVKATKLVSTISFDNVAQIKRHWAITNEHKTKQNDDLDCGNRCAVCKLASEWTLNKSTQFMFWLLGPCMYELDQIYTPWCKCH